MVSFQSLATQITIAMDEVGQEYMAESLSFWTVKQLWL